VAEREGAGREPATAPIVRAFAEQAFSRAAGAPLVAGNRVSILKDSTENYPAWHRAIASAQRKIYFENYIVADDRVGREFVSMLAAKAGSGIRVRVIYDWIGARGLASPRLWQPLIAAGAEVRCFNPPRLANPFGWLTRDHRKMIAVDGRVGFVTGLCVSEKWTGERTRAREPWRDTGVEVHGPAVADIERAFAETWAVTGPAIPADELVGADAIEPAGDMMVRVLATVPTIASLYRFDQLIASIARARLWLTDAYFLGVAIYVQALRSAAQDGVDVRLLVPGASDLPVLSSLSRSGYRPLLEAGIRVFEWNGAMLHAKTAVADGRWARVGSSNLNLSSWLGNYELDVAVEDVSFAAQMEEMYVDDLTRATEIVLSERNRVRPVARHPRRRRGGSTSRAAAGALRLGNTVGAAITNRRVLGPAEAKTMLGLGVALVLFAVVSVLWPLAVALPLAVLALWVGISSLVRARELHAARRSEADEERAGSEREPKAR
jgi:cardiolipin synthase